MLRVLFDLANSEVKGYLTADKFNLNLRIDKTGFMRIEINDSIISNMSFLNSAKSASDFSINSKTDCKRFFLW